MKKLAASLIALSAATPGAAQGWEFILSPYVWVPAMTTSVDTTRGNVEVEKSMSDVLNSLNFSLMGAFEARNGRWGVLTDVIYSDLSESQRTPLGQLYSRARMDTRMLTVSGYGAFRAHETETVAFDLLGGFRYYESRVGLGLSANLLPATRYDMEETWADAVVGARVRVDFADAWFASAMGDVAVAGDSDSSWQVLGIVGYRFNDRWSVQGGWRHLDVEKRMDGVDVGLEMSGPMVGMTYRF